MRAEAEVKRRREQEEEERIQKHISKMNESQQLSKTMQLFSRGFTSNTTSGGS